MVRDVDCRRLSSRDHNQPRVQLTGKYEQYAIVNKVINDNGVNMDWGKCFYDFRLEYGGA